VDSPEWTVLEMIEEINVRNPANRVLQTADGINEMLRAQGTMAAFILRDSVIQSIYERAKAEGQEMKEKSDVGSV